MQFSVLLAASIIILSSVLDLLGQSFQQADAQGDGDGQINFGELRSYMVQFRGWHNAITWVLSATIIILLGSIARKSLLGCWNLCALIWHWVVHPCIPIFTKAAAPRRGEKDEG